MQYPVLSIYTAYISAIATLYAILALYRIIEQKFFSKAVRTQAAESTIDNLALYDEQVKRTHLILHVQRIRKVKGKLLISLHNLGEDLVEPVITCSTAMLESVSVKETIGYNTYFTCCFHPESLPAITVLDFSLQYKSHFFGLKSVAFRINMTDAALHILEN